MPSGAIPTVLRTAGTFSPSAQRNKSFLRRFFSKKRLLPDLHQCAPMPSAKPYATMSDLSVAQRDVNFLTRLAGRTPITTHISAVFVGADEVWKLKKAVRLPFFLDFSTPASRKHFLLRELALNQPSAPEIYRDVVGIARTETGLAFCDRELPAAIDWVLRMAVIPPGNFLDAVAPQAAFTPRLCRDLADMVVRLHAAAPRRIFAFSVPHGQLSGLIARRLPPPTLAAGLDAPTRQRLAGAPSPGAARRQQAPLLARTPAGQPHPPDPWRPASAQYLPLAAACRWRSTR